MKFTLAKDGTIRASIQIQMWWLKIHQIWINPWVHNNMQKKKQSHPNDDRGKIHNIKN